MGPRATIWLVLTIAILAWQPVQAAPRPRFEALLANGTRLEGQALQDWHTPTGQPKLDGKTLLDAGNPMRWLRDRRLPPAGPLPACVEMICGDRLPGEVTGFRPAGAFGEESLPAHLLVRTPVSFRHSEDGRPPEVRVIERFVRRVVWQRQFGAGDHYEPGTVYYRDGGVQRFRAARFEEDAVRLLLEDGTRKASFTELAEIHLPRRDPWQAYYDELAATNPDLQARLLQVETTTGLVATSSLARFQARDGGSAGDFDRWLHALQPAWSLDLLWIPKNTIWTNRTFAPHQVPLSRIPPSAVQSRTMLCGGAWHWQANRSVQGGPLQSGGQAYGWGLGVHAFSQLHFPLPPEVRSLRTRLGLDETAGSGGCVRARIYAGSTGQSPLYESPFVIGSDKTLDAGVIALKGPAGGQKELILQVDPAHEGRPPAADPLDIRDMLDWLEPELELDPAALKAEVDKRHLSQVAAWDGWQPAVEKDAAIRVLHILDASGPDRGAFVPTVVAEKKPIVLRRSWQVEPNQHWLLVSASVYADFSERPKLQIRVDGQPMAEHVIPVRNDPRREPTLLAFAITPFQGHRITLELAQTPGDARLGVWWREIRIADQMPTLYRMLEDDANLRALDPDSKAKATRVEDDRYRGKPALKIAPGGRFRVATFDPPLRLRSAPAWGEYRFIRFALRKYGGGRVCLEFEQADAEKEPLCLDLGQGPPCRPRARRIVAGALPAEWIVATADPPAYFRDRDITGLVLSAPDGDALLIDQVYAARTAEEFRLLGPEPSAQLTNTQTRKSLFDAVLKRALPITVTVEIDGRTATGILIWNEGHVLTAGHVVVKPGRDATVQLANGRRVKATTAGVDRSVNCGALKLAEKVELAGTEVREWNDSQENMLYVGIAHNAAPAKDQAPQAQVVPIRWSFGNVIWADWDPPGVVTGGPLLNSEGYVMGVHSQRSPFGGILYAKAMPARHNWDRLLRGEVLGQWLPGAGPMLPAVLATSRDECRVAEVAAHAPGAAADLKTDDVIEAIDGKPLASLLDVDRVLADKNPGDEVTLELKRGSKKLQTRIRLLPRTP
jgi:S1-C subfamily serine protease